MTTKAQLALDALNELEETNRGLAEATRDVLTELDRIDDATAKLETAMGREYGDLEGLVDDVVYELEEYTALKQTLNELELKYGYDFEDAYGMASHYEKVLFSEEP